MKLILKKYFFTALIITGIIFLTLTDNIVAETLDVKEYRDRIISLYKEIKVLKAEGLLFNDCGVGACAAKEVKQWYKK